MSPAPLFTSLLFIFSLSTPVPAAPKLTLESASVTETYKTASDTDLKIYIFYPEGHDPEKDSRPAILFFFGGGWNGGTPEQFLPHVQHLASKGMVAAVADYRVKSRQGTSPFECVADGKSALRYLRKNAARLGIDPVKIAAGGGSAGGHVAAAAGMLPGLDEKAEDAAISSKPNALVLFNPVYDNGPKGGYGNDRLGDRWQEISPAHNISKDDPPTIVFLGDKDNLIPVPTAESFRDKMEDAGVKSELHIYKDQGHGFFNEAKSTPEIFNDTLEKMDSFLTEQGFLDSK